MNGGVALAVDFGGTKVDAALVDDEGGIVPGSRRRASTGATRTSDELAEAVRSVCRGALLTLTDRPLLGVGIGAAGPVDETEGLVSPLNLPAWRGFPLRALVEHEVSRADGILLAPDAARVPATLRVDGLCITLAEHWLGAGRGSDDIMGMIVSTGIGGGLILGGRTASGSTGNAGHVGHIEVGGFDDPCKCGGVGCVEAVASGPNSVSWANRQGWRGGSGEELAIAHREGDPLAIRAVERAGRALGQAIASATALVDVDVVAIGGGFAQVSPALFTHIRSAIAKRSAFDFVTKVSVVPSGLSSDGPLIGAAALVHRAERLG